MKDETKAYGYAAYDLVKQIAHQIGGRLPGSENEKKLHRLMADKLRDIGVEPKTEEFSVAPRGAIGGIPYAGYVGFAMSALIYFALGISSVWFGIAAMGVVVTIWLISDVLLYHTWFDMFFPQEISQNTYGELLPEDGEYDYTIFLSAHTDSSWTWRHSLRSYRHRNNTALGLAATIIKVGFGTICFFFVTFTALAMSIIHAGELHQASWAAAAIASQSYRTFEYCLHYLPVFCCIGCAFVAAWNDPFNRNASRGTLDNATGISLSYEVLKYFKEHPEKMPKRCRLIDMNFGSEEASLRGSIAFVRDHKGEDILKNAWNINIDSIADAEYFEVITGDVWQFTRFDKDLEKMFTDTFNEMGIESKTGGSMKNPVGGCDSTPMIRAGIKTVTFAAQNPTLTYYYHTWRDLPERFSPETVSRGFDVILSVIDKIDTFQQANGFNGVNN